MRIVNRDYETGEYTLECHGHKIRVIKGYIDSPRDRDSYFSFVSCVKPEVLVDRLGKDETGNGCYYCPDDSNFKPSGNIYVDIIRFSDARHEPPVELTEEIVAEAKRVVEERFIVFPVWLSQEEDGKLDFNFGSLEELQDNTCTPTGDRGDAVLFGALFAPVNLAGDGLPTRHADEWAAVMVEEYSSWVNNDTYIIDVSMNEELERLVMNASEGLYFNWQESLGFLYTEVYGGDGVLWEMQAVVREFNHTIEGIKDDLDNMNDNDLDPEDKADIFAVIDEK